MYLKYILFTYMKSLEHIDKLLENIRIFRNSAKCLININVLTLLMPTYGSEITLHLLYNEHV